MRAADLLRRFKALGMQDARIDAEDNVIALRKGRSLNGRPRLVLAAHLDTVFPEGTEVKVKQQNDRYYAPGIIDDARGLAAMLQVLRTMNEMQIETMGDVVFVANVGEEELGDLRGVKAIFQADKNIDGFISIDGSAVWRIVNAATGSRRFKIALQERAGGHAFKRCLGTGIQVQQSLGILLQCRIVLPRHGNRHQVGDGIFGIGMSLQIRFKYGHGFIKAPQHLQGHGL